MITINETNFSRFSVKLCHHCWFIFYFPEFLHVSSYLDRVTSDKNTSEDWSVILDVCDRVKETPEGSKECLRAIKSKLNNENPRVSLQAITVSSYDSESLPDLPTAY